MALTKYTKASTRSIRTIEEDYMVLNSDEQNAEDVNLWNSIEYGYSAFQELIQSSKLANLVIPSLFIFLGVFFIGKQIYPSIQTWAQERSGVLEQGTTSVVSDQFIDYSKYVSNPAGLEEVAKDAFNQNVLQEDTVSKNYNGVFYLSIPSLGMNKLPVNANVDSTDPNIYNAELETGLAHFENTGLPISDINNNIVIYGHSATANYNPKPNDPVVAFTFIPNLKVGDEIIIEIEGETYTYKMYKSKIVEPTDISIITGTKNKRELTLFTCYPAGNNSQRYVAVARPV